MTLLGTAYTSDIGMVHTRIAGTGATGFIGGDALATLVASHPKISYSTLIRSTDRIEQVKAQYPLICVVIGRLDDSKLIEQESAAADIVRHTTDLSDHVGASKAIIAGLVAGHSKENPGWLHTGGTGILTWEDSDKNEYGNRSEHVYSDWDGVGELLNLPDRAFHRNVDQLVLEAGTKHADVLKTALVCPPTIYDKGRGPVSRRRRQVYELANVTLRPQKAPITGAGQAIWNHIHVHDLSDVYALLVDAASAARTDDGLWGPRAYCLTENGEHCWGELAQATAEEAVKPGAKAYAGFESVSWGLNSRGRSQRARKILGWAPSRPSLVNELPEILRSEAQRLQDAS
ncbi:hypothetical protein N7457_006358 [Penicillium paradoxum]|uniref:uncharacterized protein n=1 Tax=Penicillium paradoxum TaxID=176176 RepID=UPI002548BA65|nr:uncharacterized protein N7457_006358 [Penicillium paradoxum]KAJ5781198.1 hypothetical protein N7457_006358 [Penicillium paradoxum]